MSRTESPHPGPRPRHPHDTGAPISVTSRSGNVISADTLARLEQLDDTMFEALSGDPHALDHSKAIWRSAQHAVSPQLLDESRDQYVRFAEGVWRSYESQPEHNLPRAFAALEILTMLAE